MTSESSLVELLAKLEMVASHPLAAPTTAELKDVAEVISLGTGLSPEFARRLRQGELSVGHVWADPLSEGQAGLDLLGAVMRREAERGGGRPLE